MSVRSRFTMQLPRFTCIMHARQCTRPRACVTDAPSSCTRRISMSFHGVRVSLHTPSNELWYSVRRALALECVVNPAHSSVCQHTHFDSATCRTQSLTHLRPSLATARDHTVCQCRLQVCVSGSVSRGSPVRAADCCHLGRARMRSVVRWRPRRVGRGRVRAARRCSQRLVALDCVHICIRIVRHLFSPLDEQHAPLTPSIATR